MCHKITQNNNIQILWFERKTIMAEKLASRASSPSYCFSTFVGKHNTRKENNLNDG